MNLIKRQLEVMKLSKPKSVKSHLVCMCSVELNWQKYGNNNALPSLWHLKRHVNPNKVLTVAEFQLVRRHTTN